MCTHSQANRSRVAAPSGEGGLARRRPVGERGRAIDEWAQSILPASRNGRSSARAAARSGGGALLGHVDRVGKVDVLLGLLLERVARDHLESLLNVDRLLGRGLKVRDVALGLAPGKSTFLRHRAPVEVHLVSQHDEREVIGVARARLDQELVPP